MDDMAGIVPFSFNMKHETGQFGPLTAFCRMCRDDHRHWNYKFLTPRAKPDYLRWILHPTIRRLNRVEG